MNPKVVAGIGVAALVLLSLPLLLASKITLSNYNEIEMGMSYEEVKRILGAGKTIDQIDLGEMPNLPPGAPKPDPAQIKRALDAMNLAVYVWEEGDEVALQVTLRNDKVIAKAQKGLADEPSWEADRNAMPGMGQMPGLPGMPGMGR